MKRAVQLYSYRHWAKQARDKLVLYSNDVSEGAFPGRVGIRLNLNPVEAKDHLCQRSLDIRHSTILMTTTMPSTRRLSQAFLIATSLLALVLCPYSKVEESFNLQATHDLYYYGLFSTHDVYDHLRYPGVVPRTFVGPFLLSTACRMIGFLVSPMTTLSEHPLVVQFLARLLLLMASWNAWFRLASALDRRQHDQHLGSYLLVVTACQFHLPFYASRMLPNTFALVIVLHAYAEWIQGTNNANATIKRAAACLVVATAVFRCDILLLLFTVGLTWLIRGDITELEAVQVGTVAGAFSLLTTVPLDSVLWGRTVWPEGEVFYYNAILGKSSDWGTSSWHWYLTSAIPKAMLLTTFLVPLAWTRIPTMRFDATWLSFLLPAVGFVALYSCLGHKEVRFLFPVMPIFNLAAAAGMTRLHQWAFPAKGKTPSWIAKVAFLAGVGSLLVTLLGSSIFLQVSRHNYPGGEALELITKHLEEKAIDNGDSARVWIDVASAMSGVSLFGQRHASYRTGVKTWDKAGYEVENEARGFEQYTHLLSEDKNVPGFHVVGVAQGHPRIDTRRSTIVTENAIYVLERDEWHVKTKE